MLNKNGENLELSLDWDDDWGDYEEEDYEEEEEDRPYSIGELLIAINDIDKNSRMVDVNGWYIQRYEQWFNNSDHLNAQVDIFNHKMICRACFTVGEDGIYIHAVDEDGHVEWNFEKVTPRNTELKDAFSNGVYTLLYFLCLDWEFKEP